MRDNMNIFCIRGDYVNADFSSRHNLFALAWNGKTIVDRVVDRKVTSKGFVIPTKPHAQWTTEESLAYDAVRRVANDGGATPFDFIECYNQVALSMTFDMAAKTFNVNGQNTTTFDDMICNVLLRADGSISIETKSKIPRQSAFELPLGSYLIAQVFYDRSNDDLYVVLFRRFQNQTVYTPDAHFTDETNLHTANLAINQAAEVLPLVERLLSKRWAIQSSPNYSTSIVQTRGLLNSPWVVLEDATFLRVPIKPQTVKFAVSRFFDKFDYKFKLADFDIAQVFSTITIAESPDGTMAVSITGPGVLELVPKAASRIFLGEDVVRTSDLHLRLTVV